MINNIECKKKRHFDKRIVIDVVALVVVLVCVIVFTVNKNYFGIKIVFTFIIPIIIAIIATIFNNNILHGLAVAVYLFSMTFFSFASGKHKLFLIGGFHALLIIIVILLLLKYYSREKRIKRL